MTSVGLLRLDETMLRWDYLPISEVHDNGLETRRKECRSSVSCLALGFPPSQ